MCIIYSGIFEKLNYSKFRSKTTLYRQSGLYTFSCYKKSPNRLTNTIFLDLLVVIGKMKVHNKTRENSFLYFIPKRNPFKSDTL